MSSTPIKISSTYKSLNKTCDACANCFLAVLAKCLTHLIAKNGAHANPYAVFNLNICIGSLVENRHKIL